MEGRVLELGLKAGRWELEEEWKALRRGWYVGSESFLGKLRQRLVRMKEPSRRGSHSGGAKIEHGQVAAQRLFGQGLEILGLKEGDLVGLQKKAAPKVALAWWLRQRTTVSLGWVRERLQMGHPSNVSRAVSQMNRGAGRELLRLKGKLAVDSA